VSSGAKRRDAFSKSHPYRRLRAAKTIWVFAHISFHVRKHDRRHTHVRHARVTPDRLLGHLEGVLQRGRRLEAEAVHNLTLATYDDDVARVVDTVCRPDPRVVRVNSVVSV
jgi:hypothetical protein